MLSNFTEKNLRHLILVPRKSLKLYPLHPNHVLKRLALHLAGLVSIAIISGQIGANAGTNDLRPAKYTPLLTVPQMLSGVPTNALDTNSPDVYAAWLSHSIGDLERQLNQTNTGNLNTNYRASLEWILRLQRVKLTNHLENVKAQANFVGSVRSNSKTAWTNMPDPISEQLTLEVAKYQAQLADPTLAPGIRKSYERMLANYQEKLADHETNAFLWANLHLAEQNDNREQIASAKKHLAKFLAGQLGRMQGKTYPTNMSLDAVLAEYSKQGGGSHWFGNPVAIRALLYVVMFLTPLILIVIVLRKRLR